MLAFTRHFEPSLSLSHSVRIHLRLEGDYAGVVLSVPMLVTSYAVFVLAIRMLPCVVVLDSAASWLAEEVAV